MTDKETKQSKEQAHLMEPLFAAERINQYLQAGGLFNPELMEHDKVRELLIDCRTTITTLTAERDEARSQFDNISKNLTGDFKIQASELQRTRESITSLNTRLDKLEEKWSETNSVSVHEFKTLLRCIAELQAARKEEKE